MTRMETERLHIRPLEMDDLEDFTAMMSHPEVYAMMGFARTPSGEKRARTLEEWRPRLVYRIAQCDWEGFGEWAITWRATSAFVGMVGLQYYLLDHGAMTTPEIELFYGLKRDWLGSGHHEGGDWRRRAPCVRDAQVASPHQRLLPRERALRQRHATRGDVGRPASRQS